MRCKVCGCSDREPCDPPCGWSDIEANLCTACEDAADALVEWALGSRRISMAALMRVYNERFGACRPNVVLTGKKA